MGWDQKKETISRWKRTFSKIRDSVTLVACSGFRFSSRSDLTIIVFLMSQKVNIKETTYPWLCDKSRTFLSQLDFV